MTIFGKSARCDFLMSALAAAGIDETAIATAQKEGKTDFLGTQAEQVANVAALKESALGLAARLDEAHAALAGSVLALGKDSLTAEAINAAVAAKIEAARKEGEEAGSRAAAAELAARGHAPVATAPAVAAENRPVNPGQGLTGVDRIAAIFKAEASARQN